METMTADLNIILLAYPDNPVGKVFLKHFIQNRINITGIIFETQSSKTAWKRLKSKIAKDGLAEALKRTMNVYVMKFFRTGLIHLAKKQGIAVFPVEKFNSRFCADLLEHLHPDLIVIVSAPVLKPYIFETAKIGCLNAHPGWLPGYRGIGANAWALQNGGSPGISVHFIDHEIDKGLILAREKVPFTKKDTVAKINDRAVSSGAEMICDQIKKIAQNHCRPLEIHEPHGPHYKAMPYKQVKKINKMIRDGEINAF